MEILQRSLHHIVAPSPLASMPLSLSPFFASIFPIILYYYYYCYFFIQLFIIKKRLCQRLLRGIKKILYAKWLSLFTLILAESALSCQLYQNWVQRKPFCYSRTHVITASHNHLHFIERAGMSTGRWNSVHWPLLDQRGPHTPQIVSSTNVCQCGWTADS